MTSIPVTNLNDSKSKLKKKPKKLDLIKSIEISNQDSLNVLSTNATSNIDINLEKGAPTPNNELPRNILQTIPNFVDELLQIKKINIESTSKISSEDLHEDKIPKDNTKKDDSSTSTSMENKEITQNDLNVLQEIPKSTPLVSLKEANEIFQNYHDLSQKRPKI